MRTITVSALKRDPNAYGVQKYDNNESWNTTGGTAPNGVSATRYLRKTTPNRANLSPLASFLVDHVPECVAGKMPSLRGPHVSVYNGQTELNDAFGDKPVFIRDWLFSQISPNQSCDDYWNAEAEKIRSAAAKTLKNSRYSEFEQTTTPFVKIGDAVFAIQ